MNDNIYNDLSFSNEFSIEDWNSLIDLMFSKYFENKEILDLNKELLRTELMNFIKFFQEEEYMTLFDWTFSVFKKCINEEKNNSIVELSKSFHDTANTDIKWMTNVVIQPDTSTLSDRDKINYGFKLIDEILEGVFKPRFKLFDKFISFLDSNIFADNSTISFGSLIKQFSTSNCKSASLYLEDPIFSISTNQWRNIAAHKSFLIEPNNIVIKYGKNNTRTLNITYDEFYKILSWIKKSYAVLRLAEVLIYLNYTEEVVENLDINELSIRFESSFLILIHNLQCVGFQFISTKELNKKFSLNLKVNNSKEESIIHASQCLDKLSCAINDDEFKKDDFNIVEVNICNDEKIIASASIKINDALKKVNSQISLEEYINCIDFQLVDMG